MGAQRQAPRSGLIGDEALRAITATRRWSRARALGAIPVVVLLLGACGGSSRPSYCSAVSNLENSVKGLASVNVIKNGTSSLKSQVHKIESNAESVATSAAGDFPNETSAVVSSLNALASSVKHISGTPSVSQIATIGQQAAAAVSAVKSFANATSSKCS
jgi:hypothetical protein